MPDGSKHIRSCVAGFRDENNNYITVEDPVRDWKMYNWSILFKNCETMPRCGEAIRALWRVLIEDNELHDEKLLLKDKFMYRRRTVGFEHEGQSARNTFGLTLVDDREITSEHPNDREEWVWHHNEAANFFVCSASIFHALT